MQPNREFTRAQLENLLASVVDKTLGEVDVKGVFEITKEKPLVKGIAGDVVEQSVLGYAKDSEPLPDIVVDGIETEVKTTGIVKPKKDNADVVYEAKEPVSVTAVAIDKIVSQTFETSTFWHKLSHLLFVYYLYDSDKKVLSADYAKFPIKGFQFLEFSEEDKERLKNDWQHVHDFIKDIQDKYSVEERKKYYPLLSSSLRQYLLLIDTAPKYPNPPRFRLKRTFVSSFINEHFLHKQTSLSSPISKYSDIDNKCHDFTLAYRGTTIKHLLGTLGVDVAAATKNVGECIILKMFDAKQSKMSKVSDFQKIGLLPKVVTLKKNGLMKEDMKLYQIDFEEMMTEGQEFEDSYMYSYFAEHTLLCVVFQQSEDGRQENNIFQGFKRFAFDDDFMTNEVQRTWREIRSLVSENRLRVETCYKKDGTPIVNKSGGLKEAPNFPKKKSNKVFVRGGAATSEEKHKTLSINGMKMLPQAMWVDGTYLVSAISEKPYL